VRRGKDARAGSIDAPGDGAVVGRETLWVSGWAVGTGGRAAEPLLLVDGRIAARPQTGLPRPDVAAASSHPEAERAGWQASVDLRAATGPRVGLSLLVAEPGGWAELHHTEVEIDESLRPAAGRSRAAFTIVQNEAFFLPLWLDYYGRHFDAEDIYVLDHDSADGSTRGLDGRCNVVPVHRDKSFDHMWLRSTVEAFQRFLLTAYDSVLFAEADEFLVADPARHAGLGAYLDSHGGPVARASGYNVVHYPLEGEPPLNPDEPVFAQRGYWHPAPQYSKTLIASVPLHWSIGFHVESGAAEPEPDPDLLLVHLHRADYDRCLARHRSAVQRDWSETDLERGYGRQSRVVEADEFDRWFYAGEDLEGRGREPIPERLRSAL